MNKKDNKIKVLGDVSEVELTKGKRAIIDSLDITLISPFKWFASSTGGKNPHWYAMAGKSGRAFRMHSFILKVPKGFVCDHVNGNTLDNRRSNLRICSQSQNCANSSIKPNRQYGAIYKGVYWCIPRNKWVAQIRVNRRLIYLGGYEIQEDALEAYSQAAKRYFGEFARLDSK